MSSVKAVEEPYDEVDGRDTIIVTAEMEEELTVEAEVSTKTNCSKILQIRQESVEKDDPDGSSDHASDMTKSSSFCSAVGDLAADQDDSDDFLHDEEFLQQKLQVFVLSSAGKPIFTLFGVEDKLATLFGVMQALVSVVQSNNDSLRSIKVGDTNFVFLTRMPLIMVAISKIKRSMAQIQMLLQDVYNQIISTITLSTLNKVYENRKNFDLRRLLSGSERLIYHLLNNDIKSDGSK